MRRKHKRTTWRRVTIGENDVLTPWGVTNEGSSIDRTRCIPRLLQQCALYHRRGVRFNSSYLIAKYLGKRIRNVRIKTRGLSLLVQIVTRASITLGSFGDHGRNLDLIKRRSGMVKHDLDYDPFVTLRNETLASSVPRLTPKRSKSQNYVKSLNDLKGPERTWILF